MPQDFDYILRFALYLFISMLSLSATAGQLTISLDGLQDTTTVHAALFSEQASDWNAKPVAIATSSQDTLVFIDIPAGRYALQLFADSNQNGQLDSSPRGIPLEPVGFSNNPSLMQGKPSPKQCIFHHSGGNTPLQIRLISPSRQQRQR